MFEILKGSQLLLAPAEGGGGASPGNSSSSGESGSSSPSPSSPATSTPSSSAADSKDSAKSVPATGGLKDDPQDESFVIPDLGAEFDEPPVTEIPESVATPAVEGGPATPSPTPPDAVATPPVEGQQPQTPPAAAEPQQQAPQPQVPAQQQPQDFGGESVDPMTLAAAIRENEAAAIEALATHYALKPEEVEAIQTDAVATIPKLLAKVHTNVLGAVFAHMSNLVPRMIAFQNKASEVNNKAEGEFFKAWPALDKAKHGPTVAHLARLYRQANPGAQLEDVIKFVGPWAMNSLGITPQPQAQAPALPAAVPNGQGVAVPPPFVPALGGQGGTPQPKNLDDNPFAGLGQDFDNE